MTLIDTSNVVIGPYQVAYKIDLKQSVAREMFRFTMFNSTVSFGDLETLASSAILTLDTDKDMGFYIQSLKFPTVQPNYVLGDYSIGGVLAPINPLLSGVYVGHMATESFDDNNVCAIANEYMSYVAKTLFTTAKASAIFNNESDYIRKMVGQEKVTSYYQDLYESSGNTDVIHKNTMSTANILLDTLKDVQDGIDTRSRNRLARNLFYGIVKQDFTRYSNSNRTGILDSSLNYDLSTNTWPVPILAGDTFNSFITIDKFATQSSAIFGATAAEIPIGPRKYRMVINIVADTETPNYNLDFQRPTLIKQGESPTWTIPTIKTLAGLATAITLNQ
jgi:hypothetical protein